jgi:hypothetical protein
MRLTRPSRPWLCLLWRREFTSDLDGVAFEFPRNRRSGFSCQSGHDPMGITTAQHPEIEVLYESNVGQSRNVRREGADGSDRLSPVLGPLPTRNAPIQTNLSRRH